MLSFAGIYVSLVIMVLYLIHMKFITWQTLACSNLMIVNSWLQTFAVFCYVLFNLVLSVKKSFCICLHGCCVKLLSNWNIGADAIYHLHSNILARVLCHQDSQQEQDQSNLVKGGIAFRLYLPGAISNLQLHVVAESLNPASGPASKFVKRFKQGARMWQTTDRQTRS